MKIPHWENFGITARLICITMLPVVLMFFSTIVYTHYLRYAEAQQELEESGRLIASALAQSSEYGVVSGNVPDLERTVRSLLQADKNIVSIEILNAEKRSIVFVVNEALRGGEFRTFEASIKREVVAINPFDEDGKPHVSDSIDSILTQHSSDTIGYVRLNMSPSIMLAKQKQRILVGSAIAGAALLLSTILGLYLALTVTEPLAKTIAVLRKIRGGNYEVQLDVTTGGEIGDLQASIIEMAISLDQFKKNLEAKVISRTRDLENARDQIVKDNAEKRVLIKKLNSVAEEERKRIAIEIHDHLNASLIVVRLETERILALATNAPTANSAGQIKAQAQSVIKHTSEIYDLARDIVKRLRPEIIDTLGLRDAVEEMIHQYDALHPNCRFEFWATGDFSGVESDVAITAYRLVQEALSNVVKHAGATLCTVHLQQLEDKKMLQIKVVDNGKGYDPNSIQAGIGLIGMRERVHGLGGALVFYPVLNVGTSIQITLPNTVS